MSGARTYRVAALGARFARQRGLAFEGIADKLASVAKTTE
jgi:hypothetical protein